MSYESIKCPSCGANLTIDPKSKSVKCQYCGQEFVHEAKKDVKKYGTLLAIVSAITLLLTVVFNFTFIQMSFFAIVTLVCGIISWLKAKNKLALITISAVLLYLVYEIALSVMLIRGGTLNSPYLQYDESQIANIENFTTPTEDDIIGALKSVDGITKVMAVTEYHDPNKGLSKDDGYYSAIYFEYDKVDSTSVIGSDTVDKGTEAGGVVELYRNEQDLEKRFKTFSKARKLGVGGAYKIGTMFIRTSSWLSVEEQEDLLANVIEAIDKQ